MKIEDSRWSYQRSDTYPERFKAGETFEKNRPKGFAFSGGETNSDGYIKFSFKLLGYSSNKLCSLSFWLQFTDLSNLFSLILKAIKRFFPNQNWFSKLKKKKKLWMQILENRERLSDIKINRKIWENKHFHGEPKSLKQKWIKTKIKSKPFQQKNSIKSNVSYPNLK